MGKRKAEEQPPTAPIAGLMSLVCRNNVRFVDLGRDGLAIGEYGDCLMYCRQS